MKMLVVPVLAVALISPTPALAMTKCLDKRGKIIFVNGVCPKGNTAETMQGFKNDVSTSQLEKDDEAVEKEIAASPKINQNNKYGKYSVNQLNRMSFKKLEGIHNSLNIGDPYFDKEYACHVQFAMNASEARLIGRRIKKTDDLALMRLYNKQLEDLSKDIHDGRFNCK